LQKLTLVRIGHGQGQGTVLESLSFEAGGEASNNPKTMVLSCGGIHIPQRKPPKELKNWNQIVNLPGPELSAKIFGFSASQDNPLAGALKKEFLN
jgi:hypothetical protein